MSDNNYCPIAEVSNQISRSHSQIRIFGRRIASIFGIVTSFRKRGQRKPFCRVCAAVGGFPMLTSCIPSGGDQARSAGPSSELPAPLDEDKGKAKLEEQRHTPPSAASFMSPSPRAHVKATINMLPEDVLLEIFDRCRGDSEYFIPKIWKPLVHVCRRWRQVAFASPQRLRLLLVCDLKTPVQKLSDIWPPLPVAVRYSFGEEGDENNVIATLKHRHRVCWIVFKGLTSNVLERLTAVIQEPFPVLTGLRLESSGEMGPIIPDAFLGGSSSQLQNVFLEGVAFPALPRFVASATHLISLRLQHIPDTGYISPEAMTTCLTALPQLEEFVIGFQSPQFRPPPILPPPLARAILPALTYLEFRGVSEYLEDFIARINTPRLYSLDVWLFMDLIFVIPQLNNFIHDANRLELCKRATIELYPWSARISIESPIPLHLRFKCDRLDWRLSSITRLCNELFPFLSEVERLEINGDPDLQLEPQVDIDPTQWLELFQPFPAVQSLYLSKKLGPPIAHALRELTEESGAEVLPLLRSLSFGGLQPNGVMLGVIKPFVTARQLSGHPIAITRWKEDSQWDPRDDD